MQEQSAIYGQPLFFYRGLYDPLGFAYADNDANPNNWRMTASYVTGAHNMKVGYQGSFQKSAQGRVSNQSQLEYRFNNGVPNAVSYYLAPRWEQNDRTETHSLFVAGPVDERPAHAPGRPPVRSRVQLGAGRRQRHVGHVEVQSAAHQLPGNGEREGLQRHHAARRAPPTMCSATARPPSR